MWKQMLLLSAASLILSGCARDDAGVPQAPDYLIMAYGGGVATANLPHTGLLDDPGNRSIFSACVAGARSSDLTQLRIDSLPQRLDRLREGRVLTCEDSVYRPGFPIFTGADRQRLDSIADFYADRLMQPVSDMLDDMRSSGGIPPGRLFHLLWSLVIDESWYSIWERICPEKSGPPQVFWIVDPPHECLVGTNFWQLPGGSIVSATWGSRCDEHLERLTPLRLELLRAAWEMPGNDSTAESTLERYGLVGNDGTYAGFTYQDSSSFTDRLTNWIGTYSDALAPHLDLKSAAMALGVPEDQTFVILLHEIAYALFRRLDESHVLEFPRTLKTGGPLDQVEHLVSVRLERPPLPKDVAMAVFMQNGWHGSDEVVPLFRQVLAADSNDFEIRLLLGMSLYDLEWYDEAIAEFGDLARRTASDSRTKLWFDWSRIWLGHVYDAKGERDSAVRWYQTVVDNGSPESRMSFGQYGIGPIDAVTWGRERLATPFARH